LTTNDINNQLNLNIKSEITSHLQWKFAEIMKLDAVSPHDVMNSLSVDMNRQMVFRAGQGAGLSGSFFFFSHDNRFLIKTVKESEMNIILNMVDDIIVHIKNCKNKSLLARIYGVFTIQTDMFDPLNIIIMENTSRDKYKGGNKMIFDIKGSTTNRKVHKGERFWKKKWNYSKVLKDIDFLKINKDLNHSMISLTK